MRSAGFTLALVATLAISVACAATPPAEPSPQPPMESFSSAAEARPAAPDPGPRLIRYPFVGLEERAGMVLEIVEDLVIEERDDDPDFDFDEARDMDVDADGRIYVHDSRNDRVQAFARDGTFVRTYGRGNDRTPFRSGWITIAADRLAISTGLEIAVWNLDGRYLYDRSLLRRAFSPPVYGTTDGALIGAFTMGVDRDSNTLRVDQIALDEDRSFSYGEVPRQRRSRAPGKPVAAFAATPTGAIYLTAGDAYRVRAFRPDGAEPWVLEVDAPRPPGEEGEPLPALANDRPTGLRGIGRGYPIRADGRGNLYVFPRLQTDDERVAVDVYSPEGIRLFAGLTRAVSWLRAADPFVYGIELDEATGRQRIVRYRLIAPF